MKYVLLLLLSSCIVVAQPADLIGPDTYCRPLHENVWLCRDTYEQPWRCVWRGRWECHRLSR